MSDELSTREDLENDLQDTKETASRLSKPLRDDINDKIKDEIGNRISKSVEQQAAKSAAQTASSAGTEAGLTGVGGATAQAATAQTVAGAGTSIAAGEATAAATAAGGATAGSAVAGGAAAGSVGGPVGIAVGILAGLATTVGKAIHKEMQISPDSDSGSNSAIVAVIGLILAVFFFIVLCGTLLSKGISGMFSIGHTTEFEYDIVENEGMAPAGEQYLEGYSGGEIEYNYKMPLKNTVNMYIYGTENQKNDEGAGGDGTIDGFRAALHKAIELHCKNLVTQLDEKSGGINGHWYDSEKSLETFYANKYPYDLATEDFIPHIGDVLHAEGYDESYQAKYDDVNYAEVVAILSMSSEVEGANFGFDWGNGNFDDFMRFTEKEECYQNLYELGLKWVPVYVGTKYVEKEDEFGLPYLDPVEVSTEDEKYDSPEACKEAPETIEFDGVTCYFDHYYVEVTVKPFGLRELFAMAFGGDPVEAADRKHVNFYEHTNLYMLNYAERVTRLYQRKQKKQIKGVVVDALGPSYRLPRSEFSSVYEDVLNDEWLKSLNLNGCGRSCWYYIELTYNDEWEQIEWPNDPIGTSPPGMHFTPPNGGKILDMYEYINQGDYPTTFRGSSGETVKKSGCLDCSVAMIVMYYIRQHIPITDISKFVGKNGALDTNTALATYGLTRGSDTYNNFTQGVIDEINSDRPVIIHIRGLWTSASGKKLHNTTNGHFLVGMGYDDTGLYVYDPGSRSNYHIDYADWGRVNDLYYRPVYP